MIVEQFWKLLSGFGQWMNGAWGGYVLDVDWLESFDDQMDNVLDQAEGLGIWVDWALAQTIVGSVLGLWVAAFLVKIALRIVSHFTGGGGAS